MTAPDEAPVEKFKREVKSVFLRWWEESDLDEIDMGQAMIEVTQEFCSNIVNFKSEIPLDDDEEDKPKPGRNTAAAKIIGFGNWDVVPEYFAD